MGMEMIIARIKADTDAEAERIRCSAEERITALHDAARIEADREHDRIIAEGMRAIRVLSGRIRSQAVMDARRMVREEREREIALCFSEAERELNHRIQTADYERILRNLIREGIDDLGVDEGVVIPTERDRNLVRSILSASSDRYGGFVVNPECVLSAGGVVIRSADGRITLDNTIEARIERFKSDLVYIVANVLYQEA